MNTSLQASGDRINWPADRAYPFRCVVLVCGAAGWVRYCVFEMATAAEADDVGAEMALDILDAPGVTNAHYYVGEVACV